MGEILGHEAKRGRRWAKKFTLNNSLRCQASSVFREEKRYKTMNHKPPQALLYSIDKTQVKANILSIIQNCC